MGPVTIHPVALFSGPLMQGVYKTLALRSKSKIPYGYKLAPDSKKSYFHGLQTRTMMNNEMTDMIELAARFVNSTASHIFLTGKAGTGKTTFLHNLANATHKRFVVVAPTGIAALNARGVTIHSQFLFPLGTFIPGQDAQPEDGAFYTQHTLVRRHPLNSVRKQVLRDIDLLIIDEVSMLRADLLDAIDYRLRAVKGNFRQSFGGVQLLMIGDLFQLPPVVKEQEWARMRQYYKSPFFFEAQALQQDGFAYIELDKIFRQQDEIFINILNNLRNDICTREDLETLNSHYSREEPDEEVITITTHNYRADQLNRQALDALPGEPYFYHAEIEGTFPEHIYPLPEKLELKEGAQIMFIKNDTLEYKFFNGKLATVTSLDRKEVTVVMAGTNEEYTLQPMEWQNIRYTMNEEKKEMEEEVIGSFRHLPVKLAWAITVHKSQGLTFDRAIIDVGNAFAPGQVYVALSRLRSLDGLMLRTHISEAVISSDKDVQEFAGKKDAQPPLPQLLEKEQQRFLQQMLNSTFDLSSIVRQITAIQQKQAEKMEFEDEEMRAALPQFHGQFNGELGNTIKFRSQLSRLLTERNDTKLQERLKKGSDYYLAFLYDRLKDLLLHQEEVAQFSRTKTYQNALSELDQMVMKKIADVQKASYLTHCILQHKVIETDLKAARERREKREEIVRGITQYVEDNPKNSATKTGRKRKKGKGKQKKGATYEKTYGMLKEGLSIEGIAEKRGLATSTIEGHVAKGIRKGAVELSQVMGEEEFQKIKAGFVGDSTASLNDVFGHFKGEIPYNRLRIVQAHLQQNADKSTAKENE